MPLPAMHAASFSPFIFTFLCIHDANGIDPVAIELAIVLMAKLRPFSLQPASDLWNPMWEGSKIVGAGLQNGRSAWTPLGTHRTLVSAQRRRAVLALIYPKLTGST